jgi:hypothetical protein
MIIDLPFLFQPFDHHEKIAKYHYATPVSMLNGQAFLKIIFPVDGIHLL